MTDAFIVSPLRSPVGRYGGGLSGVRADDLAAEVIRQVISRSGIDPMAIGDVIFGCANQAGEDNRNVARMASLLAGLPSSIPGTTINRLCGSALDAVIMAARAIRCGEADVVVAGGVEVMSRAPYVLPKNVSGGAQFGNLTAYDTALGWRFPNPKLAELFPLEQMGETAENVAETYTISREEQDVFALRSHQRSIAAWEAGIYNSSVIPIEVPGRKGGTVVVREDEGPRSDTSLDRLSLLKPVFRRGGTVTAGNSSSLNDGAAAMLVVSQKALDNYGLTAQLRYVSSGVAGVDPRMMGIGPVPATRTALGRAGLAVSDIDVVELNEAFASQALAVIHDLALDPALVNPNGGAIALGHPLGMSGGRLVSGLAIEFDRRPHARYGLATMCIGVGQGISAIFERV